jgi:hypothetical protein
VQCIWGTDAPRAAEKPKSAKHQHAPPPINPTTTTNNSVVNGIQTSDIRNLFNPENVFISKEGGGAGNNWASGFSQGEAVQETLLDMIGEE